MIIDKELSKEILNRADVTVAADLEGVPWVLAKPLIQSQLKQFFLFNSERASFFQNLLDSALREFRRVKPHGDELLKLKKSFSLEEDYWDEEQQKQLPSLYMVHRLVVMGHKFTLDSDNRYHFFINHPSSRIVTKPIDEHVIWDKVYPGVEVTDPVQFFSIAVCILHEICLAETTERTVNVQQTIPEILDWPGKVRALFIYDDMVAEFTANEKMKREESKTPKSVV